MSQCIALKWFAEFDCAAMHGLDILSNYTTPERP